MKPEIKPHNSRPDYTVLQLKLDYPDYLIIRTFFGPNFFMNINCCDCPKQPNNPFKRLLKQRIIPYAFQNSQV